MIGLQLLLVLQQMKIVISGEPEEKPPKCEITANCMKCIDKTCFACRLGYYLDDGVCKVRIKIVDDCRKYPTLDKDDGKCSFCLRGITLFIDSSDPENVKYRCFRGMAPVNSYGYSKNRAIIDTESVGIKGGTCRCPDGQSFDAGEIQVKDDDGKKAGNGLLSCQFGVGVLDPAKVTNGAWSYRKILCGVFFSFI